MFSVVPSDRVPGARKTSCNTGGPLSTSRNTELTFKTETQILNVCKTFLGLFVSILGEQPFYQWFSSRLVFPLPIHFWTFSKRQKNQYKNYIKDHIANISLWWKMYRHGFLILQDFAFKFFMGSKRNPMQKENEVWTNLTICLPNIHYFQLWWKIYKDNITPDFIKRLLIWLSLMKRKGYQILFHFKILNTQEREESETPQIYLDLLSTCFTEHIPLWLTLV